MRKRTVLSAASLTMCLALTACGGSGSQSQGGDSGKPLTVAIWDNNQLPGLKEIIEDFTTETGIEVEIQMVPWDQYWTLLEAGAQGGDLPDVFWMHSNYSQKFMSNDILLDLTDKVAQSSTVDMANYYQDIAELYQYDGKIYGIPKDYDTIGLWYNKTMFDEAGISYPDETWTWDTFAEAAEKLTKADGSQYGFTSPASFNQDGYYNLIYSMGGSVLSEDKTKSMWNSEETVAAMNWWYDNLVTKAMPTQQVMAENTPDVMLGSGKAAMVFEGSWMIAAMKGNEYIVSNCDVAVLPKAEDGTRISIYNGLGWSAAADTAHPDEAWKLIEYLGSEKAQKKQAELGVTMSAFMATSDTWIGCAPEFNLQAYLDMSDNMVIRPYTKNTKVWEDYSQETMVKAYTGQMTMEEVCGDIAKFMDEQIAEEQR
ncbi:MAG: sugar ABC transporter substrate-binding protein [Hungatella sp.]|jgi:multiple sugar transport system substrate-binding protein|nr:sugar ABC transporter substrate-binding protein [Hungatella sp.]